RRRGNGGADAEAGNENAQAASNEQDDAMSGDVTLAQRSQPEFDFDDEPAQATEATAPVEQPVQAAEASAPVEQPVQPAEPEPAQEPVQSAEPEPAEEPQVVADAEIEPVSPRAPGLFDTLPAPSMPAPIADPAEAAAEGEEQKHSA
ncbi:hypothetical protein QAA18_07785, partial [Luteimonas sp. 8-5]|nr:hypothetical protein [Luteimonas sp. 8-5]